MESKNVLVSIITPTYNSERFIERCLLSVASQSYTNIEHLIIDGNSTDATIRIVKELSGEYSNIKLLSERDSGVYDAMNKGIELANGEWIYFLGSDDWLYTETIISEVFSINGLEALDVIYGNVFSTRFGGVYDGVFDEKKLILKNICHQSIFFSKSIFKKTSYFDLKYRTKSDYDHNLKWFLDPSVKKLFIDKIIAYYSDGGLSSLTGDELFHYDFNKNLLKYGQTSFNNSDKEIFARNQAYLCRKNGAFISSLKFYLKAAKYKLKKKLYGC